MFFLYSSSTFHEFALFFHGTHIVCIIFFIYFFRMTNKDTATVPDTPAHFILEFNVLLIAWILFLLWNSAVVVLLTAQSDILEAYTLPLSSWKTYSPNQPFLNSNSFTFLNTLAISSVNGLSESANCWVRTWNCPSAME